MASTRRVTVRASRTRPEPQTRRSTPPSRASLMEMRTSVEMPELSICGMPFRRTTTFFAPALTTDSRASWSCSAGSPMVSRPRTSSTDTPPDSRTLISMGTRSVIGRALADLSGKKTRRPSRMTTHGYPQALYDAGRAGQGNAHRSSMAGTLHGTKAHVKRIPARIYHADSAIKDQRVKSRLLARVLDPVALASCRRSCCSMLAASETDNRDAGATKGLTYTATLLISSGAFVLLRGIRLDLGSHQSGRLESNFQKHRSEQRI